MTDFQVNGLSTDALFTLVVHRGEGMCLLGMNWRDTRPPDDFVGFCIEYQEPGQAHWWAVSNRLAFTDASQITDKTLLSTRLCPIQKFRWVHFPQNADLPGTFSYRVTPVFMDDGGALSYGDPQTAAIALARETYPGQLDISFTRGFIASQAFVDRFAKTQAEVNTLIPSDATTGANGLDFVSTNPKAANAYAWMGFEARRAILDLLDAACDDATAQVCMVAYDLDEAEVVTRALKLGSRLRIIIDDSVDKNGAGHGAGDSAESAAEQRFITACGAGNVKRQHLGALQHNKFIVVDGDDVKKAICGSTNYSFRAFFVQNNNAITVMGGAGIQPFKDAFEAYWAYDPSGKLLSFDGASVGTWRDLSLHDVDAKVTFSPHTTKTAMLKSIADDIEQTSSSLLFSLAFLYETPGVVKTAIEKVTTSGDPFVYGISDKKVGGLDVQLPNGGNPEVAYPASLAGNLPAPFSAEPIGGRGARMHHKFVVIDFNKPTARVYVGSYNFSAAADKSNGENLLLIRDRRCTTSYMVEALGIFDHYHWRDKSASAAASGTPLVLKRPPGPGEKPWFAEAYEVNYKIRDRVLFSQSTR